MSQDYTYPDHINVRNVAGFMIPKYCKAFDYKCFSCQRLSHFLQNCDNRKDNVILYTDASTWGLGAVLVQRSITKLEYYYLYLEECSR